MAQHRSLAYHPTAHPYPGGGDRGYTSPDDDLRAGREEKKPRKRNSVAVRTLTSEHIPNIADIILTCDRKCARCRKRKIKCTGDLHDGNGCEACQQAGTNQTHCFYLRVSTNFQNKLSDQLKYAQGQFSSTGRIPATAGARI